MSQKPLQNKKIAMLIAFKDFRDEECFIPKSIFEEQGAEVKIVSSEKGKALGSYGGLMDVDLTLDELNLVNFDAVIFVGGAGAVSYINNQTCHQIAKQALKQNKLLGAICIAPAILAKAGVLKNKKTTIWSSPLDKSAVKMLEAGKARYTTEPVVRDENIITADGPSSARKFAEAVVRALTEK